MSQTGSNPSPAASVASGSILSGKVALVTGASSGIGAACGAALARSGAHVILAARRGERLSALREQLHAGGSACHVLELDVRHAAAVTEGLAALPGELQAIDILINSAGLGRGLDKLHEGDPREWDEIIDTNVKGLLYVTRAVLPQMVARDTGHIVNIGEAVLVQVVGGRVQVDFDRPVGGYPGVRLAVVTLDDHLLAGLVDQPDMVVEVDDFQLDSLAEPGRGDRIDLGSKVRVALMG